MFVYQISHKNTIVGNTAKKLNFLIVFHWPGSCSSIYVTSILKRVAFNKTSTKILYDLKNIHICAITHTSIRTFNDADSAKKKEML